MHAHNKTVTLTKHGRVACVWPGGNDLGQTFYRCKRPSFDERWSAAEHNTGYTCSFYSIDNNATDAFAEYG